MTMCQTAPRRSFAGLDDDDTLARKDVASLLDVSPRTLEAWAVSGQGPPFLRLGEGRSARVRYRVRALKAWLTERERQSTTE